MQDRIPLQSPHNNEANRWSKPERIQTFLLIYPPLKRKHPKKKTPNIDDNTHNTTHTHVIKPSQTYKLSQKGKLIHNIKDYQKGLESPEGKILYPEMREV